MTSIQVKIKTVSVIFRWLFIVFLIAVPLVHIISWLHAPAITDISGKFGFRVDPIPKGVQILLPLSSATKLYGFLIGAIPVIFIECMLYFLIRLFQLYEHAEIFSIQNVKYIQKIGYTLLIIQIADIICDGFLSVVLTWANPPGFRTVILTLSGTNITLILSAFITILVSWIMTEGCRLREEQQLTV